jgi:hypothetical protein
MRPGWGQWHCPGIFRFGYFFTIGFFFAFGIIFFAFGNFFPCVCILPLGLFVFMTFFAVGKLFLPLNFCLPLSNVTQISGFSNQ